MDYNMFAYAFLILQFFLNINLVSGQSEQELLLELRNSLKYDPSLSTKLQLWNESIHFCRWAGVECEGNGRVVGLDLSGESISHWTNGANSSLFKLRHLQSLSIAQNELYPVEIPSGFGQLTELRYLNLSSSGFSGQIPLELSNLTRLVILDLSNSYLLLHRPNLQRLIHNFTRLRELYLDGVNISANGNEWGRAISSSLPNLRVLSMPYSSLTGPFHSSLLKLRSLSVIILDSNNFSSHFPDFFADFPNLEFLTLSSCSLSGVVPSKLFHIKSLQTLSLNGNEHLRGSLPEEFPVNGSLQYLELELTKFSGTMPESIGNLRMLSRLDFYGSNFSGQIPRTIRNLTNLVELSLAKNRFSGSIPSFASLKNLKTIDLLSNRLTGGIPDSYWKSLDSLVSLDLSGNSLEGEIPASLFHLPALQVLVLSNNSFTVLADVSTNALSKMLTLDLSVNELEGSMPKILFELESLVTLHLSSNKFSGSLELTDFHKLKNLSDLDLSYNNLSVHANEETSLSSLFPSLEILQLASCKLQKLPDLRNHSSLMRLDISNNDLEGEIPNWMWEINDGFLSVLNLSHNRFSHLQEPYNLSLLNYLNLHDNMLVGQIPLPLSPASVLIFSSNKFSSLPPFHSLSFVQFFSAADNVISGTIPSSFCNASGLEVLDLSNNRFSGGIPLCLLDNNNFRVLSLRGNNLDGDIPNAFPVGCNLATLDLSRNYLRGKVPKSLTRCRELEVLDLTINALSDTFPCWLHVLSKLRILVMRSNMLYGSISCLGETGSSWRNLHILDFAFNNISGIIPAKMFRNLQGFMIDVTQLQREILPYSSPYIPNVYYRDSVTVTMKGKEYELVKILRIFTTIDFSFNNLQGVIPEAIGELKSLRVLNLSHNALSGLIPSSTGDLKKLESLDLSFNSLHGKIPQQLASLSFLAYLDLANNHLVGMIPRGAQLDGLAEAFVGNDGLCGLAVNRSCISGDGAAAAPSALAEGYSDGEMYGSAALGFLVGLGFLFGPPMFCQRWRTYYGTLLTRIALLLLRRKQNNL